MLTVWKINNITISGERHNESIVLCAGSGGFIFQNIVGLSVDNLSFLYCGYNLPTVGTFSSWRAALLFVSITNLRISQVTVCNGTGYGISASELWGDVSISDSLIAFNAGSTDYIGGNVFILVYNNSVILTIDSCTIAFGGSYHPQFYSPGLQIHVGEVSMSTDIRIINCQISSNMLRDRNTGSEGLSVPPGNAAINLFSSIQYTSHLITVENCTFKVGVNLPGLVLSISGSWEHQSCSPLEYTAPEAYTVHIFNTIFHNNFCDTVTGCGGLTVSISNKACHSVNMYIKDTMFDTNGSQGVGGNILIVAESSNLAHTIKMESLTVTNGLASKGGGLFLYTGRGFADNLSSEQAVQCNQNISLILDILNTNFSNNWAQHGGGLYVLHLIHSRVLKLYVGNSTFQSNSATIAGKAMYLHSRSNKIEFENVCFFNHKAQVHTDIIRENTSPVIFAHNSKNVMFVDCAFYENEGTAISAVSSTPHFQGNINFQHNTAENGGALSLFTESTVLILEGTNMHFISNHANNVGGAIYIQKEFTLSGNICFFVPLTSSISSVLSFNMSLHFENNTAQEAGDAIYGGTIDKCPLLNTLSPSILTNITLSEQFYYAQGKYIFDYFCHLKNQNGLSPISSDPIGVCLCTPDHELDCENKCITISAYPGADLNVTAVIVGQRNGVVPGVVLANLENQVLPSRIGELQNSQATGKVCTPLEYTLYSARRFETLILTVERPNSPFIHFSPPTVQVLILTCHLGFQHSTITGKCECSQPLKNRNATCNINEQTILRQAPLWVGYHHANDTQSEGVLIYDHCPFDYCKLQNIFIDLSDPDEQCAFNRSGLLCGACQSHLSLALGTSKCMLQCSNKFLLLLVPFALAGLALVFVLTQLNLTVSEGTLNGLILYANIVHSNRAIFFPDGHSSPATVFIAWINLDLGIETCFFNDMDTYAKTWLQFLFPLYIWAIVIAMIVSSHYYILAAKLFRRHAVKVLATLFLLSYAKMQRTTISALSFATITYPEGFKRVVWLLDGNVLYLQGKHIPLFIAGVATVIFLSIPYSLLLLFTQCLQRMSGFMLLKWVAKMKPFSDAYSGPYKEKTRFWTGFILCCLNFSFLAFSLNALGDPALNLLVISLVAILLLAVLLSLHGVHRRWPTDILEASFYTNLAATASASFYTSREKQAIVGNVSVLITFLTFIGIILYHMWKHILVSRLEQFKTWYTRNRSFHHQIPHDSSSESSDESGGAEPVQLQPLVLEFDHYREPVLRYADSD